MITLRRMKKDFFAAESICVWSFKNDQVPPDKGVKFPDVIELTATAEDLEYIKARFENIPVTKTNSCVWRGAMAQFIYDNLGE